MDNHHSYNYLYLYPLRNNRNRRLYTGSKSTKRKLQHKHYLDKNKINLVSNFSSIILNKIQLDILNKGLTFAPTLNKINYNDINKNIIRFERKLQLHHYFFNKDKHENIIHIPFNSNADWWPNTLNPDITLACYNLKQEIHKFYQRRTIHNLTQIEKKTLNELKDNTDITIKKADKGGGIAILNTDDYLNKISDMLNDKTVYTKTNLDDTLEIKQNADLIFQKLNKNKYISNKQLKNLTNFKAHCPIFYGLPKIHKINIPLRPIVSQINGPTSSISKYVSELLFVAEREIPDLLKDTTSFLNLIELNKNNYTHTYLITMDVTSLYTNIPHEEGAKWVSQYYTNTLKYWDKYNIQLKPVTGEILEELILFILKNCTFEFNNDCYKQNFGTTMGANFSVRFANIYMFMFYTKFLASYEGPIPNLFSRYIDDIFGTWQLNMDDWQRYFNTLNNFHNSIKFTYEISDKEVHFLDTTVYIVNNNIHTKLYTKPTDRKQYLHFKSNHPIHVKKALPFSQALRNRRITDDDSMLKNELETLKNNFLARGYPTKLINKELIKIKSINRNDTLIYKTQEDKKISFNKFTKGGPFLPLIINFDNRFNIRPTLNKVLENWWTNYILINPDLYTFIDSHPQLVFKKGKTLSNFLVKNKISVNLPHNTNSLILDETDAENINILEELDLENNPRVSTCNIKRCLCCNYINPNYTFRSTNTNNNYYFNTSMNCNVSNVIYLITCKKCKIQYVGETGMKLKNRLNNHLSCIRTKKTNSIAFHFNDITHHITDLTLTPIETNFDSLNSRRYREKFWMKELKTLYPLGLNNYPIVP